MGDEAQVDSNSENATKTPKGATVSYFVGGLDYFPDAIRAVADLAEQVAPLADALDEEHRSQFGPASLLKPVPPQMRSEVREFIVKQLGNPSISPQRLWAETLRNYLGETWGIALAESLRDALSNAVPRTRIFLNSLLVHAVSTLESHFGSVAGSVFMAVPELLDAESQQPEFSLRDLKSLDSIDGAIELAIERRVDKLARGGLADWRKHFKASAHIELDEIAIDYDTLVEVFQRRNVIVHHNGRASAQYVRMVKGTDIQVGEPLDATVEYLHDALQHILVVGHILSIACIRKFEKDEEFAARRVHRTVDRLFATESWLAIHKLVDYGLGINDDAYSTMVLKVNLWLSAKRIGGAESIRDDVEKWDVSALDDAFELAKACLLDDMEVIDALVRDRLEAGQLRARDLLEWPMLEEFRSDSRFSGLRDRVMVEVESVAYSDFVGSPGSMVYHVPECGRATDSMRAILEEDVAALRAGKCCSPAAA